LTQSNADLARSPPGQAIEAQIADAQLQLSHDQLAYVQHMRAFQTTSRSSTRSVACAGSSSCSPRAVSTTCSTARFYLQQMSVSELQLARKLRAERDSLEHNESCWLKLGPTWRHCSTRCRPRQCDSVRWRKSPATDSQLDSQRARH